MHSFAFAQGSWNLAGKVMCEVTAPIIASNPNSGSESF